MKIFSPTPKPNKTTNAEDKKNAEMHLQAELKKFEAELYKKPDARQRELLKQVRSVVGIGKRATAILIVTTQGFKHTETYQQLISYAGLSRRNTAAVAA